MDTTQSVGIKVLLFPRSLLQTKSHRWKNQIDEHNHNTVNFDPCRGGAALLLPNILASVASCWGSVSAF